MSLYISNKDKLLLLQKQKYIVSKDILKKRLYSIEKETINYINNFSLVDINNISNESCFNPINWQLGHINYFYLINTLELLKKKRKFHYYILTSYIKQIEKQYNINGNEFFDSFKTPRKIRFSKIICIKRLKIVYKSIIKILLYYINNYEIDSVDSYLIMLSILHNDMHNENFNFTFYYLKNSLLNQKLLSNIKKNSTPKIKNIYIDIPKGFLHQGHNINNKIFVFDNETPSFLVKIPQFQVNKYPITEYEFLDFVKKDGYNNAKYWSQNGLYWKNTNNIEHPLYWFNINNIWYRKHLSLIYEVGSNLPICNISWYEAEAFCKWKKVRLIKEHEWEYLATNLGRNLFPWGDENITDEKSNINNNKNYCIDVDLYKNGDNIKGVSQLIGNIWEWCEEAIYPYNNFSIDYIYREMSYPYFGQKKICRGGCFCVNDYLIHSKYRNAQDPGCQIQFIGFRTCLKTS